MTHPQTLAGVIGRRLLSEGWTVSVAAGPAPAPLSGTTIPATVPGVVHTDLLAAGLIPDPYLDDNESALAWIGLVDWTYSTRFETDAAQLSAARVHHLVFDGVDTVATITLNGSVLGEVANQHRTYRYDVTALLHEGANELVVALRSPIKYADRMSLEVGPRPRPYPMPYEAIRKSACNFGWDWGIATYTSGIWRPVTLESWSVARLAEVRVVAEPDGQGGTVSVQVEVERAGNDALEVEIEVEGVRARAQVTEGDSSAAASVHLDHVERWWPVGHGAQPLYDVRVALHSANHELDSAARRVGFRTLEWNTTPDGDGTPFQLVVNGRPIFVKGVNWIPDDALPSRVDRARYERRLRQAADANLNLIRVWGGGIYEADDFYDLCDELGLLTWQDFLFACAAYPEEEPLRGEIEAEARQNVTRIAHHTSLALLTGNNENLWGFEDWDWKRRLDGRTWGAYYYYELFPELVAELAPHVPYAPGSPFSPETQWDGAAQTGPHPNDARHGTMHLWEQWNRQDWVTYRDTIPRFVAEFGWQGPPTWTTLTHSISDDPLTPESPGMIVHQKALDGNVKLETGLLPHYRVPTDTETWHWAMQLNQANAVGAALDWFRSHAPRTSGAVVWQLNDCWPVTSWAAIDGYGREKPLLHAIRNSFAPRRVLIQPHTDGLVAVLDNDTDNDWAGELALIRRNFDGTALATQYTTVQLPARTSVRIPIQPAVANPQDPTAELVTAEALGTRGEWFFAEPRDSALPAPRLSVAVETDAFVVTAETLIRDLAVLIDKIAPDASVDRGLVTLLPGECVRFVVRGAGPLTVQALAAPGVLRSGNELVAS